MQATVNNYINQEEAKEFAMREKARQLEDQHIENLEKERHELKKRLAEANSSKATTNESETAQKGEVDLMLNKSATQKPHFEGDIP